MVVVVVVVVVVFGSVTVLLAGLELLDVSFSPTLPVDGCSFVLAVGVSDDVIINSAVPPTVDDMSTVASSPVDGLEE